MLKVIINGTFDILHKGHLALIDFARHISGPDGQVIVAIDSDRRVKELKGDNRPVNNESERVEMLQHIVGVTKVYVFDSEAQLEEILKYECPSVMVKGDDYVGQQIVGQHLVQHIAFVPKVKGYSTTNKILKITQQ